METPKERLEQIYNYYGTNASSIEALHREIHPKSKFTKQTLYNISDGLTKSISTKTAGVLSELFPDVNYLWLTTGLRSMHTKEMSNEDFTSHIPEPALKGNPTIDDALKTLEKIQNGKDKNSNDGKVLKNSDVIHIKTFVIPMKGFAGLKGAIYSDSFITENFKETTTEVPHYLYSPISYRIQSTGNSMPKSIPNNAWVTGVPIDESMWFSYKFKEDKIYVLFHPERGILFKKVKNISNNEIKLCSENEDKHEYPDEKFKITDFRKILLAIKVETFI